MFVTDRLESFGYARRNAGVKEAGDFGGADLDPRQRVCFAISAAVYDRAIKLVVPHPHLVKSEIAKDIFGGFDHGQLFFADGFAVRNTRTEASHLGFISSWQAEGSG